MKIETTVQQIRALLQLAEIDAQMQELSSDTHRSRREASRRRVGAVLLDRYQKLLDNGRWPAIAAIERGGCSGCHVRLPTMVEHQARHAGVVHTCPHCRRLLYAAELVGDDAGAAAPLKTAVTSASAGGRS